MATWRENNGCGGRRGRLLEAVVDRLGLSAALRRHVEHCPRCRRLMHGAGRLGLAWMMVRTQSHSRDLLLRANRRAIQMLRRDVRELPQARRLRTHLPSPALAERLAERAPSVLNAAACALVLLFVLGGLLSSFDNLREEGSRALRHYYAAQAGQDIADEIF